MSRIKSDNRGMIIVFTLILLAVFLTAALGFSYFIIGDINKARAIDDSVIAYYAADAGIEESLYLLKKQGLPGLLDGLKAARPGDVKLGASAGIWNILGSSNFEKTILRQRLYNGQSVKFFILKRGLEDTSNKTKSVTVEWYKGAGLTPKLQINLTQLSPQQDAGGNLIYYQDYSQLQTSDSSSEAGPICINLKDSALDGLTLPPRDYMVELKALGAADDFIGQIIVKAYDNACGASADAIVLDPAGITNLTLKSLGTYGRAQQNIYAQILPRDPVSGLLGFVLFSEQEVTKE